MLIFNRILFLAVLPLSIFFGGLSKAQVNLQDLYPSDSSEYVFLGNSSAAPGVGGVSYLGHGPLVSLQFNYVEQGLSMVDAAGSRSNSVVEEISTLGLGVLWGIRDGLSWGFNISGSSAEVLGLGRQRGVGDLRLSLEKQFLQRERHPVGLSLTGSAILPTGEKEKFLSNGSLGAGALLAVEKLISRFTGVLNLGYFEYETAEYRDLNLKRQLVVGGGLSARVSKNLSAGIEGVKTHLLDGRKVKSLGEIYLGINYRASRRSQILAGGSSSFVASDRSSNLRMLAAWKFMPGLDEWGGSVERVDYYTTIERCGARPVTLSFPARRLTADERLRFADLPYVSTKKNAIGVKQIGEMTGLLENWPVIENSQVLFAVDLNALPKRSSLVKIESAFLKMAVRKISSEFSTDTEILCLLDEKICSGELFKHPKWQDNKNQVFFQDKKVANTYFSDQYLSQPIVRYKNRDVFAGDLIVDMKKIIENSSVSDLESIFFGSDGSQKAKTQYFLVADDTFISNDVYLELLLLLNSCHTEY